ncbi:hypothetical protein M1512_04120 [Patescibacteria group bacterium]|nr:hypothetical protein [Patescibacteria group bacterium]
MDDVLRRLKPTRGFSSLAHNSLLLALPLIIFALVRLNESQFTQLAIALVVLSKWRMFAVRPRFWPANIRANAVDLMVGISIVLFMTHSGSAWVQFGWAIAYGFWLIYLKPATSSLMISLQAGIGQLCGLSALYLAWAGGPLYGLMILTGLICYLAARHFFDAFDESYSRLLSYLWGYFSAALVWILGHWLLYYGVFAQPTVILAAIGYGVGAVYYWDHYDKLSISLRRQLIAVMLIILLVVIIFSDWGSKVV